MTNEEFKNKMLDELKNINGRLSNIESTMAAKEDVHKIVAGQQKDIMAMLQLVNGKIDESEERLAQKLDRLAGDVTYLVRKAAEHEDDIRALRRAK